MKKLIPITLIILNIGFNVQAQIYYSDDKTGNDYEINQNTDKKIINAFLEEQKATAIEFNTNDSWRFPFRLKNKKGNWALFDMGSERLIMERESKKYSFQFPTALMEERGFTLASRKGKTFFVNFNEMEVQTKMGFDEIIPRIDTDTLLGYNPNTGEQEESYHPHLTSFKVKKGEKWGLIEPCESEALLCVSHNFLYNSPQEVPSARDFDSYQLVMIESIRKENKIDLIVALDESGYLFKGRKSKTNLWGVYGGEGDGQTYIPSEYDKINKHRNVFEVWKNDKVGYYNGDYKLVFEPRFDGFKYVHLDYFYGCALKKNGKWELYDAFEPEKLVEGSAATIDELIELWLNR